MTNDREPPTEAITQVVEWLIDSYIVGKTGNRRFYAQLVVDLLTRTGGLIPGLVNLDPPLRLRFEDPYNVLFRWSRTDGAYQLEGVVVHRHDGEPFLTSDLRSMPWRALIDDDVQDRLLAAEFLDVFSDVVEEFGTPKAREQWAETGADEYSKQHLDALTTPSRRRYGDDHYLEVARLYDEALSYGSRAPNRYIADRLNVESTSTVKNWVSECRRRGLLPPTQERKMRGNR